MDENEALALFEKGDDQAARDALAWLLAWDERFLQSIARRWLTRPEDQEDALGNVYPKLWRARPTFRNRGVAAWRGLLKLTTVRCCIDVLRNNSREFPAEDPGDWEVHDEDLTAADNLIALLAREAEDGTLLHLADTLWLALDLELPDSARTRQLLAASLFYLDRQPISRVQRMLGASPAGPPVPRERLESWLGDVGVLRHLAYQLLHYTPDELAGVLLGLPEPLERKLLDALAEQARIPRVTEPPPAGWTWAEALLILWRYRNCLTVEEIVLRRDCTHSREQLNEVVDRSRARFPFTKRMTNLLGRLSETPGLPIKEAFQTAGLWQRLAFQYRYADQLSQRDILDRVQPPAGVAGYSVTPASLTAWLSADRLINRLLAAHGRAGRSCND